MTNRNVGEFNRATRYHMPEDSILENRTSGQEHFTIHGILLTDEEHKEIK
jgi:hypothetical protein